MQQITFEHSWSSFFPTKLIYLFSLLYQTSRQIAAILSLRSFAQVLALSNVIANTDWQLVPSAVLAFLIWITSHTSNDTNRSFQIRHQTAPGFGHFWPWSHLTTTCHLQVICQQVVPTSKNTGFNHSCSKPQSEPPQALKYIFKWRRIFKEIF